MSKTEIKIVLFAYFVAYNTFLSCLTVIFKSCLCQNTRFYM